MLKFRPYFIRNILLLPVKVNIRTYNFMTIILIVFKIIRSSVDKFLCFFSAVMHVILAFDGKEGLIFLNGIEVQKLSAGIHTKSVT